MLSELAVIWVIKYVVSAKNSAKGTLFPLFSLNDARVRRKPLYKAAPMRLQKSRVAGIPNSATNCRIKLWAKLGTAPKGSLLSANLGEVR